MRPLVVLGVLLIFAGGVVLAMRGVSYTKDREAVSVGPVEIATERRGFISPVFGIVAVVLGGALVFIGRRSA